MAKSKRTAEPDGFLESAAQMIGSTLGSIALKTGLAEPKAAVAPAKRMVKKSPGRAQAAKPARRKAAVKTARRAPAKKASR